MWTHCMFCYLYVTKMWNVIFYWCLHISVLFNKFISPMPGNLLFYVTTTLWNYRRNSEPETAQNWRQYTKILSERGLYLWYVEIMKSHQFSFYWVLSQRGRCQHQQNQNKQRQNITQDVRWWSWSWMNNCTKVVI